MAELAPHSTFGELARGTAARGSGGTCSSIPFDLPRLLEAPASSYEKDVRNFSLAQRDCPGKFTLA